MAFHIIVHLDRDEFYQKLYSGEYCIQRNLAQDPGELRGSFPLNPDLYTACSKSEFKPLIDK